MPPRQSLVATRRQPSAARNGMIAARDKRRAAHLWVLIAVCSAHPLAFLWQNQHDHCMKHSLSSPIYATLLAAAVVNAWGQQSGPGFSSTARRVVRGQDPGASGQELLAQAAKRLANERQIVADLRYQIDAYGHLLHGTGRYLQQGQGNDRLLRLELRMQIAERPATLLEIRGPDLYWQRREIPPAPPTLERLNLLQLRRALTNAADDSGAGLPHEGWIVLGGLPRLLAALEANFAFAAPRADEVQYQTADGKSIDTLPIWVVAGTWKPDRLAALARRDASQTAPLPDQLPDTVEVVLSRTADQLPLFPFRITYRRAPSADQPASAPAAAPRELLTLSFFNVATTRPIDAREFLYYPSTGDVDPRDITTASIQRLTTTPRR
jgi:hypothetical protein